MKRHNRTPHQYQLLQPVKFYVNSDFHIGLIISKIHKLPKKAALAEEPFYLVTGFGLPVWESNLIPITEEEYKLAEGGK